MGDHGFWAQPSGLLPNGLLPEETATATQLLDVDRWLKAEEQTAELIARIQPNPSSEERRNAVANYVERLVTNCLSCKVFTFGSVPLKTYLPDGDIDLTAFSDNDDFKDTWATTVCSVLENEEKSENPEFCVKEIKYIQAEVKLIKCLVENIVVDISFNQVGGLCTLCFLEEMDKVINRNHLFKRSIILIKAWCYYESRILGAHHGLISTYALETLVLYIFHVFNNSFAGPLEVLYRFLEFFSNFDWDNYCVSLWGPVPIRSLPDMSAQPPRKDNGKLLFTKNFLDDRTAVYSVMPVGQENQSQPFISKHFNVVDPLRTNNNLGRSVSKGNFFRIRSALTFGAKRLTRLLECPKDSIVAEVNQFFTNTWKRHAIGDRPDIRMDLRPKQPIKTVLVDEPDNLKFSASGGNRFENGVLNVGEEHLAETGKSSHNSVSELLSNHHNVNALDNQSAASHVQSQTNHKKQNNSRFTSQVERSHRSGGFVQSDKNQKIFKPNYSVNDKEQQSRFHLARTRSSPELTETSSDFSGGRRDGELETAKVQGPAMFNSGTRRKNLGSDTGSHSSKSSFDDYVSTMQTSSQKNLEVASDANSISNVHQDDFGFTNMREELASVSENLERQQEEQDLVNMMGSSSIHSFNGHISFPMHLTPFHLPLTFSPVSTSMGYGKRNLAGVLPSNLPLIGGPWGSNILFARNVPFPVPHYFPTTTYSSNLDSVAEPSSDGSAAMEPSVEDNNHDNWHEDNVILSRGFNPGDSIPLDDNQSKLERTTCLTARGINSGSLSQDYNKFGREDRGLTREDNSGSFLSKTSRGGEISNFRSSNLKSVPLAQASASRSKYPSDHLDRSIANTSKSAKDKWSRKSISPSVPASAYGKENNRLQLGASPDNISVEVDDDTSDWIPLTTMGNDISERISQSASSTSSHARSHHLPGHELSENQSDRMIPFAPVLVGTSQPRALDHSKFLPTFFPAGPLVPYYLLPFGSLRSDTENPDGYAWEFDREEGPDQLQIISADHNIDPVESHNQSEAVMSPRVSRTSAPELPEEPNPDILNSDLNGHRQNLEFGRFCQNSYCHAPFMHAPRVVESPINLSTHFPWDGSGRSNLNYTQFMGHNPRLVLVTPLQSGPGPDWPTSACQRNVDEAPRYRGGTGTYLPNPKAPHRDRHSNLRNNRGNRSHDWNDPGDRSRAVDRSHGRSHGRSQGERATFRPDRQAASRNQEEKRWATYKHELLASQHGPDRTVPSTSSSNTSENAFGMYPEASFRSNGVIPPDQLIRPVELMYPYDQGVGNFFLAKTHEFGSRTVHRSSGNGTRRARDKVSEGELYNQRHGLYHRGGSSRSSPDRPSSPN